MEDIIKALIDHIDLKRLKIGNFTPVIFLCGGKILRGNEDPVSARDFFLRKIKETEPELFERIFLAEVIETWFSDLVRAGYPFPDLLTFEKHLSGLASFICLIVESPGSIAELGAFSSHDPISERLMVVISHKHETEDSFISLGPISLLREKKPKRDRVFVYPLKENWNEDEETHFQDLEVLSNNWPAFLLDLKNFDKKNPKNPNFDPKMEGHVSLLIGDLLGLFSALKVREIKEILAGVKIDLNEKQIKGHLLILEKLEFVEKYPYRSGFYYVALEDNSFIDYNFKGGPSDLIDRKRFKVRSNAIYRKKDQDRILVIRAVRRAQGEAE